MPEVRRHLAVALAFLALAVAAVAIKGSFEFIVSDGRDYYAYLPSLVLDGDVDFTNQIQEHWGPDFSTRMLDRLTPTGRVANRYPIGLALTLLPSFVIAEGVALAGHALAPVPALAPDGYSAPFQILGLLTILGVGLATMVMLDRWLVRCFGLDPAAAFGAVVLFWIGSPYAYYYFREPFMVHVVSTFWVAAAVVSITPGPTEGEPMEAESTGDGAFRWRGPRFGFCTAMAIVCRPTNVVLLLLPLVLGAPTRRRIAAGGFRWLVALVPLLAQAVVWKALWGRWVPHTYGGETFHWGEPALLATLISPRHGLFLWSPLLVAGVTALRLGFGRWAGGRRRMVAALSAALALLWYLNSAWETWWFGDSFGARAFIEMAPVFVLGLAIAVEWALRGDRTRKVLAACAASACVGYSWILMVLYIARRVSRSGPLF